MKKLTFALAATAAMTALPAAAQEKWDLPMAYSGSNFHSVTGAEFAKCVTTGTGGETLGAGAGAEEMGDVTVDDAVLFLARFSGGAVASFDRVLGRPIVMLGFTNPDDNAHSPNESLVLANYEGGIRTIARYWQALSEG